MKNSYKITLLFIAAFLLPGIAVSCTDTRFTLISTEKLGNCNFRLKFQACVDESNDQYYVGGILFDISGATITSVNPTVLTSSQGVAINAVIKGNVVEWGCVTCPSTNSPPVFLKNDSPAECFNITIDVSGTPTAWIGVGEYIGPSGGNCDTACPVGQTFNGPCPPVCTSTSTSTNNGVLTCKCLGCDGGFCYKGNFYCGQKGTIPGLPVCPPSVTATGGTTCVGSCIDLNAAGSGGKPPYKYTWQPGNLTDDKPTVCPTVTSTYTVTVKDSLGVTAYATALVTVNPAPSITASVNPICQGTTATLAAGGGSTYTWSGGTSPATGSSVTATPTATSTYTVTGTDANGCTNTATAVVTVNPPPSITVNVPTICKDSTGTLSATGGINYKWSTGETASTITVTPVSLSSLTYTVTGTDANGCTNSIAATVTVKDCSQPVVTVTGKTMCAGSCADLIAKGKGGTAPLSYVWSPNIGSGAGPHTVCPSVTTVYTVTVTDSKGSTETDTAVVTIHPQVTVAVTSATICQGETATLNASGADTYSWNTGSNSGSITIKPVSTSSYTVTGTDAKGCTNTAAATVTVNPTPFIRITPQDICPGDSAILTATGAVSFTWSDGQSKNSIIVIPSTTTSYTVTGTSASGCSNTATATVSVAQLVTYAGTDQAICAGKSSTLTASGGLMFTWSPATGLNTSSGSTVIATPSVTTTYTVIASIPSGCTATDAVTVTVNPIPLVHFYPFAKGCAPLCVNFTDSSLVAGGKITQWLWDFGEGSTSTAQHPSYCYTNPGIYDVSLTVSSENGCSNSRTINDLIAVYPKPKADFSVSPQPTSIFNPWLFFKDLSSGNPISWNWTFWDHMKDSVVIFNLQNPPVYTYSDTGTYKVQLVVNNSYGCQDVISKYVIIAPEWSFYIPNTFTPNGDGMNDGFIGKSWNVIEHEMWIFDRWGNMVYNTGKTEDTETAVPWNGKVNNGSEVAQIDTYVWIVALKDVFGKKHKYWGHVNLIK